MPQTAHADPHEPQDASAAPRPRETFGLQTHSSECVETAGRVAVDLANRSGDELEVVHAFEFVPAREYAGVVLWLRSPADFRKQWQKILDEQVDRIGQMGGEVADARLCVGSPVDQILCRAEASDADLFVVGRRGLGGVKRLPMGSVFEGIVQHARCPVLVVCGDGEVWPPAHVVISDDRAEGVLVQVYLRVLKSSQEMSALESKIGVQDREPRPEGGRVRARGHGRRACAHPREHLRGVARLGRGGRRRGRGRGHHSR